MSDFDPDEFLAKNKKRRKHTVAESALKGAEQGLTFGFADELGAALQGGLAALTPGMSAAETYRQARDDNRRRYAKAQEDNSTAYLVGEIGGGVLAPVPGAGAAVQGAKFLPRAAQAIKSGAKMGAAYGLGASDADLTRGEVGEAVVDTALGTVLGGAGGGVGETALTVGKGAVKGLVKATRAAKELRKRGVDLTVGQMDPGSRFAQMEEVATSNAVFGPPVRAQRDAARAQWQDVVLDEARAPGMPKHSPDMPVSDRLAESYEGFEAAYAPAKEARFVAESPKGLPLGLPPPPKVEPGPAPTLLDEFGRAIPKTEKKAPRWAFDAALKDKSVQATDETRAVVRNFLEDQASLIPVSGKTKAEPIFAMRSNIRQAAAEARKAQDFPRAQLLERAEKVVSETLESQLPEDAAEALRAADAQYAKQKLAETAVQRAGDNPNQFTPAMLSGAIKSSTEKGAYARGGGNESLRELASLGQEVLDSRIPNTGARLLAAPGVSWATSAAAHMANRPLGKALLLGETAPQRAIRRAGSRLPALPRSLQSRTSHSPGQAALRPTLDAPPGVTPALAEEDEEFERRLAAIRAQVER
jgi:hypothetical protein